MQRISFHIAWIFFTCLSLTGWAQVNSPLGRFQVDYAKGCAPLTVTITDLTGGPTAQYLYDADTCVIASPKYDPSLCPPSSNTTSTSYTYTEPGTYSLVQVVASQIPRGDTIVIEVLPPQQPQVDITLCNNYRVSVKIIDTYYERFLIDYGDGTPPTTAITHAYPPGNNSYPVTVSGYFNNGPVNCGSTTKMMTPVNNIPMASIEQVTVVNQGYNTGQIEIDYTLGSPDVDYVLQAAVNGTSNYKNIRVVKDSNYLIYDLNTIDSVYCYRIAARERCSNIEIYSNTVCSISLQVTAENGQNQVNWNTVSTPQFSQYEVERNNMAMGPPITNAGTMGITDTGTTCDQLYCYQISTQYNDGGRSTSVARCVTGINSLPPPAVASLTASIDGGSIIVDWDNAPPLNFFRIFRSENNGPFEAIGQGESFPYTDTNLRPQINTYCYYLVYQNTCGQQSEPSTIACAMKLSGENPDNQHYVLDWTPYTGWENGVADYQLEIMDENGSPVGAPISLGPNATSYLDPITNNRQISQYRVLAISNDTVPLRSVSNIIKVDIPIQIFVPNSFTPNNDGLNDTFNAQGLFIDDYSMEIYNRWGELLFHSTELEQGWNGVYKGSLSPEDGYVYRIEATDTKGRVSVKQGTLYLLRKDN